MIIGVDGGALSIDDDRLKVGVYKVTARFLQTIPAIDTYNNYRLYTFRRLGEGIRKHLEERIEERIVRPVSGWQKVWLPLELAKHPVDVFLGFSQSIPWNTSYNIGVVYDLAYLHVPQAYPQSHHKLKSQTDTLVRRSRRIITISSAVKADLIRTYTYPAERIHVCPLGIDEQFVASGPVYHGDRPYFLFAGALKPIKNIPTLIRAFARLLRNTKTPHDLYLIGGDLWMDPEIEPAIKESGVSANIKRLGYVPDAILAQYYRGATAFVSTSLWEGFCLPAVEAMACGTPVIVSDRGSLPEVVGEAGIVVDPMDIEGLSGALKTLATSPPERKKRGEASKKQIRKYSWEEFTKNVYSVIRAAKSDRVSSHPV